MTDSKYNIDDVLGAVEQRYFRGWGMFKYAMYTGVIAGIPLGLTSPFVEQFRWIGVAGVLLFMPVLVMPIYSFCRRAGVSRFQAFLISFFTPRTYKRGRWIKAKLSPKRV